MNPSNLDHADLTAYALGELPHEQEREMREWIAANPEAQAELARIEFISEVLHHSAPIPTLKFTPQQRQSVLTPPKGPRILTPMMPRQPMAKATSRFAPFLASVTRIAAALVVAGIAFEIGRHSGTSSLEVAESPVSPPTEGKADATSAAPIQPNAPAVAATTVAPKPVGGANMAQVTPVAPDVAQTKTETQAVVASVVRTEAASTPGSDLVVQKPSATPVVTPSVNPTPAATVAAAGKPESAKPVPSIDTRGYAAVSREPVSKVTLRPHDTRPVPVRTKGDALASPVSPKVVAVAQDKAPTRAPDLAIQSWKAEVASCPWNSSHKLMRVLVQAPADQLAATSASNTYPLQVKFDELTVRSYRLLSESHVPPHPGTNNAAHVMWYEVIPNGAVSDANREAGRSVATVSVANARFDSPAVGPFESKENPTLRALDRGVKWENAREDFLFETAIVGFGLLLRGEENLGSLNHELVLKLAQHAKGDKEVDGERAKFIRLVQEARRMTGI